ncbi:MAG: LysM domain-containing protein, partial [Gammaproteobacteria bacterium]|nr:LysM domain-containing protein [Gammaproteobacteria bacterium]
KHGVSMAYLKKVNGISKRRRIRAGQTIVVPLQDGVKPYLPDLPAPKIRRVRYKKKYKKKLKRPDTRTSAPAQRKTWIVRKPAETTRVQVAILSTPRRNSLILPQHPAE